jgi:ATP-dependent Clp protease ATP-binding subunit ClpA
MEGFSPHLISVIALAEEEAQTSGSIYVAPEHLLLGLLRFRDEAASELLRKSGLDVEKLSGSIPKIAPMTEKQDIQLDEESKVLLKEAWNIALEFNESSCTAVHLVMAFMRLGEKTLQQKFFEGDWNQSVRNGTHLRAQKPENLNPEAIKYKITSWQNRAEMATKQGNQDLAREALKQISEYEKLLLDGDSNGNTKPRDFES